MLKLFGWQLLIEAKPIPPKHVIIVIPHTSAWDFPIGLFVRSLMQHDVRFVGKDSLFKGPLGSILRWLGGIPVDRSKNNNFVEGVSKLFDDYEELGICLSPEGTRKRVHKLKTGFYYIAKQAGVPILLCKFDYGPKLVTISQPFFPTDDMEADFKYIDDYFRGTVGYVPEWSYLYGE